jgi:hypothetical protein
VAGFIAAHHGFHQIFAPCGPFRAGVSDDWIERAVSIAALKSELAVEDDPNSHHQNQTNDRSEYNSNPLQYSTHFIPPNLLKFVYILATRRNQIVTEIVTVIKFIDLE